MNNENKPLSASERISSLEQASASYYGTISNIARDVMIIKDAIKLLGNKVDAIVKASEAGMALNDDVIAKLMIENNVEELKNKVDLLVGNGALVPSDEIALGSFVVGREVDENNEVKNPRLQFPMDQLQPELVEKLLGKKAGETVVFAEDKLSFEVMEVYNIAELSAPAPVAVEAEVVSEGNDTPSNP